MKCKRILSLVLAMCMAFGSAVMLPDGVFSESTSITASAETIGDFEYNILDDGTVEITKYNGSGGNVTIPSSIGGKKVTSIGYAAFKHCTSLTNITIPSSVTSIGLCAFYECTSLTSITIPNSVTSIGGNAFAGCTSLESITIPNSVTSFGYTAFSKTKWLENQQKKNPLVVVNGILIDVDGTTCTGKVTIPDSVKSINDWAFACCTGLTSITIPSSVKSIGYYAFYYCQSLISVIIPSSVTSIGNDMFYYCTSLKSITIPNSVTSIGYAAFEHCTSLTSVTIPSSITTIDQLAFVECTSLKSITIPSSVTSIGNGAFGYYYDQGYKRVEGFRIKCYKNTAGEKYAIDNGFDYEIIEEAPISIADCTINLSSSSYTYDGKAKTPSVTVYNGSNELKNGTDYDVAYKNNVNAGTATVTVTGNGEYTGSVSKTFKIAAANLSSATIHGPQSSYTYTGKAIVPAVKVVLTGKTLTKGTDYTVTYKNNIKVGTATIVVTGKGNYTGSVTKTFKIIAKTVSISGATIHGPQSSYTYTGKAIAPAVKVVLNGKTLTKGTDYTVTYKNNIKVGTATIVVTGKGNYTGSVSKTFKIVAKTVSISGATIHGPQSSYTYTGKAIAPAVKVVLTGKTLTKGTDYTVAYKNNVKVGTATIVVTGKGSYTGSVTKTFKIVAKSTSSFVWGKDNWNFNNSKYYPYYFSSGTYRSQINSSYLNKLKNNLTNSEYQRVFVGTMLYGAEIDEKWGGSCYGMSTTAVLATKGLLPYSSYGSGATKLHDLAWPTKNGNISSLITYYQMLQFKDVMSQQFYITAKKTHKENITKIISLLKTNSTVLICFYKPKVFGHAIFAYGYEYGSWTKNGVTYQGRIKICDPNSSMQNDENCYIYFNTKTYNWAIPFYSGITSSSGATIDYVGANLNEINQGGYLSGKSSTRSSEYIARIDAASISDNRSVTKVKNANGYYKKQYNAPGDIEEAYSYVIGGKSKGTIGYNLYDSDSAYKVTQSDPVNLQLSIKYQDCRLSGGSAAGNSVIFDKNGFVSVNGESARFNISMTHDINFPTDWFTVQVKGDNTNDASLKKVNNGWVVSADRLQNVEVAVNNKEDSAHVKFSSKYKSALIYEINKKTIGIAVDTDNNGTYETKVKTEDMTQTRFAGSNRAETGTLISAGMYKTADTVIIATGFDFHDALAAVPLASAYNAPLLLADRDNLSAKTLAEIKRLKAKNVIVVASTNSKDQNGKDAAIRNNVYKQLKDLKVKVTKLVGSSYYETAKKVAVQLKTVTKKNPTSLFITTDKNYADALSASPVAAILGAPILYVDPNASLNSTTKNYLASVKSSVKNVYIVGGVNAVSASVEKAILNTLGKKSATRFAGDNRYDTCVKINKAFAKTLTGKSVCIAKGYNFPDALAGGVFAAKNKAPLFLADALGGKAELSKTQSSYLKSKNPSKLYIFGGETAIPTALVKSIAKASV